MYLYDYDAVEILTARQGTHQPRPHLRARRTFPSWFFEQGVVFLPEEIEVGLRVGNRTLRRAFRAVHGDLMTVEYWERLQQTLRAGEVPGD